MATTPDVSGGGHAGTLFGPGITVGASPWSGFGNAFSFPGGAGHTGVYAPGVPKIYGVGVAAAFTLEASVQLLDTAGGAISGWFFNDQPPQLWTDGTLAYVFWQDETFHYHNISGGSLSDLLPHKVAADYDGTTIRLYVDGVVVASMATTGIAVPDSTDYFWIGSDDFAENLHATIDEVRLSVGARYAGAYTPDPAPFANDASTLALFHLDGFTGSYPSDSAPIFRNDPALAQTDPGGILNHGEGVTFITLASPTASLTQTGALPSGFTFTDNGDGTATLAGTAGVGTAGDYPITVVATNMTGTASQDFTLSVSGIVGFSPTIGPVGTRVRAGGFGFIAGWSLRLDGFYGLTATSLVSPHELDGTIPGGGVTGVIDLVGFPTSPGHETAPGQFDVLPHLVASRGGFSPAGSEIGLSWNNPGGGHITAWTLEHSDDGGATWTTIFTASSPVGAGSYDDTGLDPSKVYVYRLTITYDDSQVGTVMVSIARYCGYSTLVEKDLGTWGSLPYFPSKLAYCGTDGTTDYYALQVSDRTGATNRPHYLALATVAHGIAPTPGSVTVTVSSVQTSEIFSLGPASMVSAGDPYSDTGPLKVAFVPRFITGPIPPPHVVFAEVSGGTWVVHSDTAVDLQGLTDVAGFRYVFGYPDVVPYRLRLDEVAITAAAASGSNNWDAVERFTAAGGQGPWFRSPPGLRVGAPDPGVTLVGGIDPVSFVGNPWTSITYGAIRTASGGGTNVGARVGDLAIYSWVGPTTASLGGFPGGWTTLIDQVGAHSKWVVMAKKLTLADLSVTLTVTFSPGEAVDLYPIDFLILRGIDLDTAVIGTVGVAAGTTASAPGVTAPSAGNVATILAGALNPYDTPSGSAYGTFTPAQDSTVQNDSNHLFSIGSRAVSAGATSATSAPETAGAGDQYGIQLWSAPDPRFQNPAMTLWTSLTPVNGVLLFMEIDAGATGHDWTYVGDEVLACDGSGNWSEAQAVALPPGFPAGLHFFTDTFVASMWFEFAFFGAPVASLTQDSAWVLIAHPGSPIGQPPEELWKVRWNGSAVETVAHHLTSPLDCNAELVGFDAVVYPQGAATSDSVSYWVLKGRNLIGNLVFGEIITEPPGEYIISGAPSVSLAGIRQDWGLIDTYFPYPELDSSRPGFVIAKPGTGYWPCCPVVGGWVIGAVAIGPS